jgi:hypothetical protein
MGIILYYNGYKLEKCSPNYFLLQYHQIRLKVGFRRDLLRNMLDMDYYTCYIRNIER